MLDTLKRNIIYGSSYMAFEHLGDKLNPLIRVLLTQYKKGEINIAETLEYAAINDLRDLATLTKHGQLILNNEQVLSKEVAVASAVTDTVLLNQGFPSIDVKEFYYDIIRLKNKAFVFICRKAYVLDVIDQYETLGVRIRSWRLGITPMQHYDSILNDTAIFHTDGFVCEFQEGTLESITSLDNDTSSETYRIQDLEIDSRYINLLGIVLENVGVDSSLIATNANEAIKASETSYKQHRFYALGLPLAIGSLLLIFLVNFFIYNHYFTKVEQMEVVGNSNTIQKDLLHTKDSIVGQKQQLFEDVIASSSSASSYLVDQIIAEMPATILLDRLSYHPLSKAIKKNKALSITKNTIEVAGNTAVNADLSRWISSLEKLDFVKAVSFKDLEKGGSQTHFKLTLNLGS